MKAALLIVPALAAAPPQWMAAAPGLEAQEANPARIQLPSGLTAMLWEEHDTALIRMEGFLPIGPEEVPAHLPGLPALLLATLEASPKGNRSAAEFQALLDRSGIRLELALDPQGLRLSLACRSRDQELAFGLLGDFLGRTPLDPEALEPQRLKLFRRPSPNEATERFLSTLSGSILIPPPESTLARAGLGDLEILLARVLRPARLRLHIQGGLSPAQATQRLMLDLGAWNPARVDASPAALPVPTDAKVEREGPGELLIAFPPLPPEDAVAALFGILLPSRLEGRGEPGDPWRLPVPGETPQAALANLQSRLAGLTFTEAELKAAKAYWKGRQALLPLDPAAALRSRLRGMPAADAVDRLTHAEFQAALRLLLAKGHRLWRGNAAWLKAAP
ncbi:MAG: hypothetical protein HYZ13_02320 [Acidobacteria bacterium]|nr:hypothetical protein [Acidobacteriota bacterium]